MSSVFFQEEVVSNTHKMIVGTNNCGNEDNNYLIVLELATGMNDEPASLNVVRTIPHETAINHICTIDPQSTVIATKSNLEDVLLYDYRKYLTETKEGKPLLRLRAAQGGAALACNRNQPGSILAATSSGIYLFDILGTEMNGNIVENKNRYTSHKDVVEDVAWSDANDWQFASIDRHSLMVWDTRVEGQFQPVNSVDAYSERLKRVKFRLESKNLIVTSSYDNVIALWDIRNLRFKMLATKKSKTNVLDLQISYKSIAVCTPNHIATYNCDVDKWNIGQENKLFTHGLSSNVAVMGFTNNDDICSVIAGRKMQIWKRKDYMGEKASDEIAQGKEEHQSASPGPSFHRHLEKEKTPEKTDDVLKSVMEKLQKIRPSSRPSSTDSAYEFEDMPAEDVLNTSMSPVRLNSPHLVPIAPPRTPPHTPSSSLSPSPLPMPTTTNHSQRLISYLFELLFWNVLLGREPYGF